MKYYKQLETYYKIEMLLFYYKKLPVCINNDNKE